MRSPGHLFRVCCLLVLLSIALVVQADDEEEGDEAVELNIALTDYAFTVEGLEAGQPLELQAGQLYRIHFTNASELDTDHEVLLGREAMLLSDGASHLDYAEPMFKDVEVVLAGEGYKVGAAGLNEFELEPGASITLEFTLPAEKVGDWEMGCFEFLDENSSEEEPGPTHYDAAMHLPIVVTGAA